MDYTDLKVNIKDIPWKDMKTEEIDYILDKRVEAFRARPSPKREGYVVERIAQFSNLWSADTDAQSGGKVKRNKYIRLHNLTRTEHLRELQMMILTLEFPRNKYHIRQQVSDAGKVRDIVIQDYYPWRILQHAIMNVIEDKVKKRLIYDTCACVRGKGLHFGVKRMKMFIRRYDVNYFWKADYKKFYQSIPQGIVIDELRKMYKDERFIELMEIVFSGYESDIEELLTNEREKRITNRGE